MGSALGPHASPTRRVTGRRSQRRSLPGGRDACPLIPGRTTDGLHLAPIWAAAPTIGDSHFSIRSTRHAGSIRTQIREKYTEIMTASLFTPTLRPSSDLFNLGS
ncbi:hypothetical protein DTO063F5_8731 [Paecilomyces variotii]|nr:hypothetical protein DTO063F5_8731 [Paecilomyces variotii]